MEIFQGVMYQGDRSVTCYILIFFLHMSAHWAVQVQSSQSLSAIQMSYLSLTETNDVVSSLLCQSTRTETREGNCRFYCGWFKPSFLQIKLIRRERLGFSVLQFGVFFRSICRFLCQKTSMFQFWCSLRFADFSIFSMWFSIFVENNSVFLVSLLNVVCIRFWPTFLAVLRFWMISFSLFLRFLIYPNVPLN